MYLPTRKRNLHFKCDLLLSILSSQGFADSGDLDAEVVVEVEFLLALLDLLDHEQDLQGGELLVAAVRDVDGRLEVGVVDRGIDPVPLRTLSLKKNKVVVVFQTDSMHTCERRRLKSAIAPTSSVW